MLSSSTHLAGPTEPSFLQALRFGKNPIAYLEQCAERYGHCFSLNLPGDQPKIACSHPEDVRRIFALKPEDFTAAATALPAPIGDGSLLFMDGDEHLQERKMMAPMLLGERLSEYGELMKQTTDEVTDRWSSGESYVVHEAMREISLKVIVKCIFGIVDQQRIEHICQVTNDWLELAFSPALFTIGLLLPAQKLRAVLDRAAQRSLARYAGHSPAWRIFPWQRLIDRKAALIALLKEEMQRCRREADSKRADILALMVAGKHEDGSAPSDERIVDQLITMLVGGHETTANAMSWALSYMLPRPDVMAKVKAELAATFAGGAFALTGVRRLTYLDACIQESMRMLPVPLAISRVLLRPLELSKCVAPAGSNVWACMHLTQRRPELWPEPHSFRPERFLPDNEPKADPGLAIPRESNYPFGGGRRRCLGMSFANYEMRVVLSRLLLRTSLRITPDSHPQPLFRGVSFTPGDTLRVVRD